MKNTTDFNYICHMHKSSKLSNILQFQQQPKSENGVENRSFSSVFVVNTPNARKNKVDIFSS